MQDSVSIQPFPTNAFDVPLILAIHNDLHGPLLNKVIPWMREPLFWVPLYLLLLVLIIRWFKKYWWLALAIVLAVASLSDYSNSSIIKKLVQRPRPCNETGLREMLEVLVPCGGGFSFMSSHACNHMAVGIFFFYLLRQRESGWAWIFIFWAFVVGFAQVYVGVHYPSDVLAGFVYGGLLGFAGFRLLDFSLKRLMRNKALV